MGHKRRLSRLVSQPLADLYPRLRPATSCRHIALGKHTRTGRQAQRRRQTHRPAHRECERLVARERERERQRRTETRETETLRERERQKVAGDAPRCRRCAARRIVVAPTTDSRLRSLLAAPSARRVAHRCGARETDCVPCAPAPRPRLLRSVASTPFSSLALSPRSPPPAWHTPPKPA